MLSQGWSEAAKLLHQPAPQFLVDRLSKQSCMPELSRFDSSWSSSYVVKIGLKGKIYRTCQSLAAFCKVSNSLCILLACVIWGIYPTMGYSQALGPWTSEWQILQQSNQMQIVWSPRESSNQSALIEEAACMTGARQAVLTWKPWCHSWAMPLPSALRALAWGIASSLYPTFWIKNSPHWSINKPWTIL